MIDVCLAILAGGSGERFRHYKPLIQLGSKKLIEYILENLAPYFNRTLLVVKNDLQRELLINNISKAISKYDVEIVLDKIDLKGPIAGIITATEYCNDKLLALAPSDTPFIKFNIYEKLRDYVVKRHYDAAIPIWPNNYTEPLISLSVRERLAHAAHMCISGRWRVQDVYSKLHTAYVNIYSLSENPEVDFLNINNYGDLELALKIINQRN
jgi:molybdopterin-guanine dinucleotide biosynthesis protein A